MTETEDAPTVDEPIGGEYALTGGTEKTVYSEEHGDFRDVTYAVVKHPQDDISKAGDEIARVVDLLNEYDAKTIRERTINGGDDA